MLRDIINAVLGVIIGVILGDPLKEAWGKFVKYMKRLLAKPKTIKDPSYFTIGNETTSFIVCDGDGVMTYSPENIETRVNNHAVELPSDLKILRREIEKAEDAKKQRGESYSWNGPLLSLEKYSILRTKVNEDMKVIFSFVPSDYYTFKALNMNLDKQLPSGYTIREKYLAGNTVRQPIPALANGVGVAITVITSDNYVILTKRSPESGVRPNELDISVVEAIHPSHDRKAVGQGPDLFNTAVRGAEEELGVVIPRENIKFLGFGVDEQYYQWNIIGIAHCKEKAEEIMKQRSRGIPGKWEMEQILFIPFKIRDVLYTIKNEKMWSTAKVALYWSLVFEYTKRGVDKEAEKLFK
ncbi:hypothetical protein ABS784_16395 [Geobacillus sp. G4]|uniref:Nudix hydrolase domain-containing protein n=2 Tax=Geobacillus TaxID=129337 RepID=A0A7U9JCG6_GEOTM|nr:MULTISPECIES: hypothetical protein [Geobacillus]WJQ06881.1 hypothetical protein QT235_17130 [Geobacillus stearothermophilus]AMV12327.1 hypothetical protein GT3570_15530 [Geobacillus thermoleovorans]AUI37137.1 hypothetical protein CWI35_12015 [[Bacillus] caldolyticus]EQB96127.1 hypothetical protein GA8_07805 [Geobacillus sp. A8]ESU73040.1 hypothetical protein T260_04885 [Geobacillus sp. MAS1]